MRHGFLLVFVVIALLTGTLSTAWASDPIAYGYRDFQYPNGTGGNSAPTGEKPESKLWWNDGYWWGSLWSSAGNAYHIHRLDLGTQSWIDTGTPLDDRSGSRADALWDGQRLYVASHIFAANAGAPAPSGQRGELYRYSYDSGTKAYTLDPGFPVEITGGVSETLVLEKDSAGQLWVTYVEDQKVMVNHSNGDDLQWATPFMLPVDQANVSSDDISSIITYNEHVGIMWSNQISPREMHFAVHPVGSPDDVWTQVRAYSTSGDDHISLRSLEADSEGNVYAAIKTSRNAELIVLLVCERNINRCRTQSDWSSYPVYDNTYSPTRPILLIDASNRELYIFSRNKDANGDDGIYYKTASLDNIAFAAGIGTPFIKSATETGIDDPTSTKQNLTSTTGLVVLASDSGPDYYFHNYKSLAGTSIQHTLTVNAGGAGSVTLDPPGGVYDEGTVVSLTATPEAGWVFSGWSGDLNGSDNPASITMDGNKTVTATFSDGGGGGGGEVVHQETQTGGSTGSNSVSTTAPLTAASGDVYVAAIGSKSYVAVQSVSGLGLNWARVREQCAGRNQTGVEVWLGQGTPNGNDVVSATLAGTPNNAVIAVSRYSGVATVGNVVAGNTNGVDGACTGGSDSNSYAFDLATTAEGSVVYSAAAIRNKRHEPGAGYTERAEVLQGSGGSTASVVVQDRSVPSPATVAVEGSLSSTVDWAVVALELRPGAQSAGSRPDFLSFSSIDSVKMSMVPLLGTEDMGRVNLGRTYRSGLGVLLHNRNGRAIAAGLVSSPDVIM